MENTYTKFPLSYNHPTLGNEWFHTVKVKRFIRMVLQTTLGGFHELEYQSFFLSLSTMSSPEIYLAIVSAGYVPNEAIVQIHHVMGICPKEVDQFCCSGIINAELKKIKNWRKKDFHTSIIQNRLQIAGSKAVPCRLAVSICFLVLLAIIPCKENSVHVKCAADTKRTHRCSVDLQQSELIANARANIATAVLRNHTCIRMDIPAYV